MDCLAASKATISIDLRSPTAATLTCAPFFPLKISGQFRIHERDIGSDAPRAAARFFGWGFIYRSSTLALFAFLARSPSPPAMVCSTLALLQKVAYRSVEAEG